jgi:SAM-dependent methyltransferase
MVREAHGMDLCDEMLRKIDVSRYPNLNLSCGTIESLDYPDGMFDKVVGRLVFHHILDDAELDRSIRECHRVLRPGGRMILSEGVPPHPDLETEYAAIFALKEDRRTFMPEDLRTLLQAGGFEHIRLNTIIDEHMSVRNWLENAGNLERETIEKIYDMHRRGSDLFKREYNLEETEDDILIDVKVVIVIGTKPRVRQPR